MTYRWIIVRVVRQTSIQNTFLKALLQDLLVLQVFLLTAQFLLQTSLFTTQQNSALFFLFGQLQAESLCPALTTSPLLELINQLGISNDFHVLAERAIWITGL